MPDSPKPVNSYFRLVIPLCAMFIVTILAMVAVPFGDPDSPPARFLDENAGMMIAGEVIAILLVGLIALYLDRKRTLRENRDKLRDDLFPSDRQENE